MEDDRMKPKSQATVLALLALLIVCWATAASAHPYEDYPVIRPFDCYGRPGLAGSPEWNYGDITFAEAYPDPATLTDAEAYMLNGCAEYEGSDQLALASWHSLVMLYVKFHYSRFGEIPAVLTPQVCADAVGKEIADLPAGHVAQLVCPLTGDYPRLDAAGFSPGNLYVKVLSEDEMRHFAGIKKRYDDIWFKGIEEAPSGTYEVKLTSPVYYVRMYGRTGVIHNAIRFGWRRL